MADGPGKYGAVANMALLETGAQAVVLLVLAGKGGNGFSVSEFEVQGYGSALLAELPVLLRNVATNIEADLKAAEL